jgi:hypothetical protein
MYYGAAAGAEKKALRRLEEPNVAISYGTQNNEPWGGIENLLVDCGGSPSSLASNGGEYEDGLAEYADYVERVEPETFVLRDYPVEDEILEASGRTVRESQQRTTADHFDLLNLADDRDINAEPMAVVQGRRVEDYLRHIEELDAAGVLDSVDCVGIGSVCGRTNTAEIARIIHEVGDALPDKSLHGFGVKTTVLESPQVVDTLDSADSLSYSYNQRMDGGRGTWQNKAYHYLAFKRQIEERIELYDDAQTQLGGASA